MPQPAPWRIKGVPITETTLFGHLARRAAERGSAHAIEIDGARLTFGEWHDEALRAAAGLAAHGVRAGDRVATMLPNSREQLLTWFGCIRLGAVYTPLNIGLSGADLAATLADADARLLIADATFADVLPHARPPTIWRGGMPGFETLLNDHPAPPEVVQTPAGPCAIIYTGGTTGRPKGVVQTHFSYLTGGVRYCEVWQPGAGDVHYSVMQMFHSGCLYGAVIAPLISDATSVIDRRFSASRYWARVRETGATLIDPLGTMITWLVNQPPDPLDRQHSVRACWFATAHLPAETNRAFRERFGIRLAPATYALSESGGNYIVSGRLDDPHHPDGACGKPWGWCEVMIADANDQALPPGEVGQILLRPTHPHTFLIGYHNDPVRTQAVMRNFWLQTGDLGRLDANGYLWFEGREAHWLRRRGENISCREVEAVLQQHPDVAEACVVGVQAGDGEEEVKAFLILRPGRALDPAGLAAWLGGRLSAFKQPRYIEIVADLPRSETKREFERGRIRAMPNATAWDREAQSRI
jgi:crotonobetaine/carnitine-CoA ligase